MISERRERRSQQRNAEAQSQATHDSRRHARSRSNQLNRKRREFAHTLAPIIDEIRAAGVSTLKGIAKCLNARGFKTPLGRAFTRQAVAKALRRVG